MNNDIFPLDFPQHLLFVVIATAVFLLQYARLHYKYQLMASFIPPLSMLTYVADNRVKSAILSVIELTLITVALIYAAKERRAAEREKKLKEAQIAAQKAAESYALEESTAMTAQESWSSEPLELSESSKATETEPEQDEEKPSDQEPL